MHAADTLCPILSAPANLSPQLYRSFRGTLSDHPFCQRSDGIYYNVTTVTTVPTVTTVATVSTITTVTAVTTVATVTTTSRYLFNRPGVAGAVLQTAS